MEQWWSKAAIVLAVTLFGCLEDVPPEMHGDTSFTLEERAAIERGNVWLAERVGREPVPIVWDLPHGETASRSIVRGAELGEGVDALATQGARITFDEDVKDPSVLAVLAAHEFGHYRGLEHHAGPGIMNEAPIDLVWTAEDEASRE